MCRQLQNIYGDRTEQSVLVIQDFQAEDLQREFNCSVENLKGRDTRRAELQQEGVSSSVTTNLRPYVPECCSVTSRGAC